MSQDSCLQKTEFFIPSVTVVRSDYTFCDLLSMETSTTNAKHPCLIELHIVWWLNFLKLQSLVIEYCIDVGFKILKYVHK